MSINFISDLVYFHFISDLDDLSSGAAFSRASSASLGLSFSFTGFTLPPEDIADSMPFTNEDDILIRLHNLVGNAAIEDRYILVGAGSSQLYQVVLYAPSKTNSSEPMSVVSAAPFYSSYPLMTDYLKSGLYRWAGDAYKFNTDEPYIELVTSPNNPNGTARQAVVNKEKGILVHDLAYYWPQYTPISFPVHWAGSSCFMFN